MEYNIYIDSEIGFGACSAAYVREQVESLKGQPCHVYISSLGGSLPDALQIYQAFKDHGNVTATFFGICASAATILAMGAKTIQMSKNAILMIHNAGIQRELYGRLNAAQLEERIATLQNDKDALQKFDEIVANIYAERAKGDKDQFAESMSREDWFTADEAQEIGLVDCIVEDGEKPVVTESMKRQFVACGYPMPHFAAESKPTFLERLRQGLITLGLLPEKKPADAEEDAMPTSQNDSTIAAAAAENTKITMNKTFNAIMSCLTVESLAENENGSITLSVDQMSAIEAALAAANKKAEGATAQLADRDAQITALNEQVENLKNDDAVDPGEGIPTPATSEAESANLVFDMSNLLRDI